MMHLSATVFFFLATTTLSAKLPSSFTKCDRKQNDFQQCLTKSIQNALSQLKQPIKEVGLPNMDPLEIPALVIGAGSGTVGFKQNYKNMKVAGFVDVTCEKAEMDFDKKILNLKCITPKLTLKFEYEIKGKILMLPISGEGPGMIVLSDCQFDLTFNLEEYDKKSKKYYKINKYQLLLVPKKIVFTLENLFNGDKNLGDNVNQVMNDNWAEMFADVKPSYEEAFGKIFASIFDSLLGRVPISDLFGSG